jgi:NADPH-dependent 7-cyano-7-deazaguanine reductase QueF-like protein
MDLASPIHLTYLGRSTPAPKNPDEAILDRVPNAHPDTPYLARFSAPEFTTLCAVTGQPDFAHFVIDYVPKAWLIESKSLKFYWLRSAIAADSTRSAQSQLENGWLLRMNQSFCG